MTRTRLLLALAAVLLMTGCSAVRFGPDPTPGLGFRGLVHVNGDFDGQALADSVPLTALIRGHGDATITIRAFPPPFVTIDGTWNVIVEPVPLREAEAIAAVQRGDILIRRNGVPGALNAPGSRAAYKAYLMAPKPAPALPPPPPAPKPIVLVDDACHDESCSLPR